jgi:hypothetical protein
VKEGAKGGSRWDFMGLIHRFCHILGQNLGLSWDQMGCQ